MSSLLCLLCPLLSEPFSHSVLPGPVDKLFYLCFMCGVCKRQHLLSREVLQDRTKFADEERHRSACGAEQVNDGMPTSDDDCTHGASRWHRGEQKKEAQR